MPRISTRSSRRPRRSAPRAEDASLPARLLPLWRADADHRFVTDAGSIQRILASLGEPTPAPRIALAARGPPPFEKDFHPDARTPLSEPLPEYAFDQRVSRVGPLHPEPSCRSTGLDWHPWARVRASGPRLSVALQPRHPPRTRPGSAQTGSYRPRRITGRPVRRNSTCCKTTLNLLSSL